MTSTFAPSVWPQRPTDARNANWRFARELRLGDTAPSHALQWRLWRNCAIRPAQLLAVYAALCAVVLLIGGFFYVQGASFVLGFAGLELLALGAAFLFFARHAADRETLTLTGSSLQIEQCVGTQVRCTEWAADGLSVEPAAGPGSLVEIRARGQRVLVGRHLRPELRAEFARELRRALRAAPLWSAEQPPSTAELN
jgi:uncharacterized membrane protein